MHSSFKKKIVILTFINISDMLLKYGDLLPNVMHFFFPSIKILRIMTFSSIFQYRLLRRFNKATLFNFSEDINFGFLL